MPQLPWDSGFLGGNCRQELPKCCNVLAKNDRVIAWTKCGCCAGKAESASCFSYLCLPLCATA